MVWIIRTIPEAAPVMAITLPEREAMVVAWIGDMVLWKLRRTEFIDVQSFELEPKMKILAAKRNEGERLDRRLRYGMDDRR